MVNKIGSVNIVVNTLWTRVEGHGETLDAIYEHFSIKVDGYFFSPKYKAGVWDGKKHFFSRIGCKLPTGLLVELVSFLDNLPYPYEFEDNRPLQNHKPIITKLGKYDLATPPFNYQAEAVRRAMDAGRGILQLATNSGKSIVSAAIIKSYDIPTLYIVATKDSMYQAEDVFKKTLNTPIGLLGDGKKKIEKVTVAVINSAVKLAQRNKGLLKQFELLIYNECHHASSDTWYKLGMKMPAQYRFGMSGTALGGRKEKDWMLMGVTGELLMTITNAKLIELGISAVPKVVFLKSQVKNELRKNSYQDAVREGIVNDEIRNFQIYELACSLEERGQNVLILSPRKQHGWELFQMLQGKDKLDERVYFNHGNITGEMRTRNLMNFKDQGGIMIATTIYDEDIDIPQVNVLIMALGMKSERKVLQRVGRALRKKQGDNVVTIYDFWDWHNKYLAKHSKDRALVYKKEGFEIVADEEASAWLSNTLEGSSNTKAKKGRLKIDELTVRRTTSKELARFRKTRRMMEDNT